MDRAYSLMPEAGRRTVGPTGVSRAVLYIYRVAITYVDHKSAIARFQLVVVRTDVAAVDWHCSVNVARLQTLHTHATVLLLSTGTVSIRPAVPLIMRPSSLRGAAYCVALCLSVCLSVRLSVRPVIVSERHVAPPSELQ